MSLNYDSDDALPRSPGLRPFKPRVTPSPSPPPVVTHRIRISPTLQNVSSPSSRRRKKPNRRKTRPSQGDFVLIRIMDPNRPDIAREVGERALNSDSGSEIDDDDMDERSPTAEIPSLDLSKVAQDALNASTNPNATVLTVDFKTPALPAHRDSVVEPDSQERNNTITTSTDSSRSDASPTGVGTNGTQSSSAEAKSPSSTSLATSPLFGAEYHGPISNGQVRHTAVTSPNLLGLTIPSPRGTDVTRLPALQTPQSPPQDGSAASPSQKQQLPSFRHLSDLAETAAQEQEINRAQLSHRQSISSIGQSPTSVVRQLSITSLSPGNAYPLSAASPGGSSDVQGRDPFLRTGQQLAFLSTRRPSQASDAGPYSATLHSATTNDSYQSSDGLSPGSQGHRLSIESALSRTLPPPVGPNIQHIPSHGAGGFKCDYLGCNAAPFQTQYLLNSHANVHSQTRPHFCPVPDCPRSEGGKGFKRKNEMIRHGLVHASPGYVCPFCPDREHKYPRPDNLQRHVRVHHLDKDKDDPQLREVLAQRPEGGSRGRRRRVS
ncbi:hypothetical protein P280DRAFT_246801 [Massarina eburnea CBS 473.64]|uniref:C2H2-type domain-containing protein n=1 Tax=Massarina eburnea CBS 473.64 TaxID=1395130 RepID=A0A6A6S7M1_9PLEO|nr:hypothetical protein P280DRAFT_246801 [Massarina eburnea CBS 473.64]